MNKKLVLGTLIASMSMLQGLGGCSSGQIMGSGGGLAAGWMAGQQKALDRAKDDGVPAGELDRLIEEASEWIASVAPKHPAVVQSSYQKIFVVGGTSNRSNAEDGARSVSDEEVAIRTEDLFDNVQQSDSMRNSFVFFDETSNIEVDLSGLTGNLNQYGDPLGRDGSGSPATYNPNDIYLVKLSFNERQDLREKNSSINFTLRATIEWGGSPGQSLYTNKFESKLVFKDGYAGIGGKGWVSAE